MYQILDQYTVGIPDEIELARHLCEVYKEEAEASATDAAESADKAKGYANNASHSRDEASSILKQIQNRITGIEATPYEPNHYHGKLWLETDETRKQIINIYRWDDYLPGTGLYPKSTLYPSDDLYPVGTDDAEFDGPGWTKLKLNSAVMA